jgi:two-component system LytT family response regulator
VTVAVRAVVVDDEPHARRELARLLADAGDVDVVATCANAYEALHAVTTLKPDVLFLDVQMPEVSGFQLLGMIDDDLLPNVVFVTAYDAFALAAFEENALDYLLKPVLPDRLARAMEKVRRFLGAPRRPAAPGAELIARVPCSAAQAIRLVDVGDIEFVRSSAAGVYVVTASGEQFTELTLRVLETRTGVLTRCHKQYLVNLAHVREIVRAPDGGALLRTRSGKEVPVSRRLLLKLKDAFGIRHRHGRV